MLQRKQENGAFHHDRVNFMHQFYKELEKSTQTEISLTILRTLCVPHVLMLTC